MEPGLKAKLIAQINEADDLEGLKAGLLAVLGNSSAESKKSDPGKPPTARVSEAKGKSNVTGRGKAGIAKKGPLFVFGPDPLKPRANPKPDAKASMVPTNESSRQLTAALLANMAVVKEGPKDGSQPSSSKTLNTESGSQQASAMPADEAMTTDGSSEDEDNEQSSFEQVEGRAKKRRRRKRMAKLDAVDAKV